MSSTQFHTARSLVLRARRVWPDDPRNQREWLRAVAVVRSTSKGWVMDLKPRDDAPQSIKQARA